MLLMKNLVVSSPVIVFLYGTRYTIFENQSTTTQTVSATLAKGGRLIMKSMETDDHSCLGIDNGCLGIYNGWSNLYEQCCGFFEREYMLHDSANSLMVFRI